MSIPDDQLRRMMEQTLVPPTNVVELDPTTIEEATIRLGSVEGSLAESYQLNSSLTRTRARRLPSKDEATTIVDFYMGTASDGYDELIGEQSRWARPLDNCPAWVRHTFSGLVDHPPAVASLYSCDLLVTFDDALWRLIPGRPGFMFEGTWDDAQHEQVLAAALHPVERTPEAMVFLVGHLARSSYLTGDRAYRSAAIGCGIVLGSLWTQLAGIPPLVTLTASQQFLDGPVNRATRCDGVERGVQVVGHVSILPENGDPA